MLYDRVFFGGMFTLGAGALVMAFAPHAVFETFGATVFATYAVVLYPPKFLVEKR